MNPAALVPNQMGQMFNQLFNITELTPYISGSKAGMYPGADKDITVPAGLDKDAVEAAVLADASVQRHLAGQAVKKLIVVPGRIVNVVV